MGASKSFIIFATANKVISTTDIEFDVINIVWLEVKVREAVFRGDIAVACVPGREMINPVAELWTV